MNGFEQAPGGTGPDSEAAARAALANAQTSPADLAQYAQNFPQLRHLVAAHPNAYPDLLTWLGQLNVPEINAALAARSQAAPSVPETPAVPATPTYNAAPTAPTTPVAPGGAPSYATAPQAGGYQGPPAGNYGGAAYQGTPGGAPEQPAKKSKKGLIIGLSAGGAVVIAAIVAICILVLPNLFGGSAASASGAVVDLYNEPKEGPDLSWPDDGDDFTASGYSPSAIDGSVLLWNTSAAGGSDYDLSDLGLDDYDLDDLDLGDYESESRWYEGYDEDYADGFADGEKFLATGESDYYSWLETNGTYDRYMELTGYWDGFYDGSSGLEFGFLAEKKPSGSSSKDSDSKDKDSKDSDSKKSDEATAGSIASANLDSGDEDWNVNVGDASGHDDAQVVSAAALPGSNSVFVLTYSVADDESTLLALSAKKGDVSSKADIDGAASAISVVTDSRVLVTSADEFLAYDADDLDSDTVWSEDLDSKYSFPVKIGDDYVALDDKVVNLSDGKKAPFGSDMDDEVSYRGLAGTDIVFRTEAKSSTDTTYNIERWDVKNDKSMWDDALKGSYVTGTEDFAVLMTYNKKGEFETVRINLSNGSEEWKDEVKSDGVVGILNGLLVVIDGKKVVGYANPDDEKFSFKSGIDDSDSGSFGSAPILGSDTFYLSDSDTLTGFKASDEGEMWSMDLDDGDAVAQVGDRIVIMNTEDASMRVLKK
ncbi:variant leucine-rich repeat-containing protein [Lysinibacter cavernae]|uniref:Leucine rich repeat variant domain-containing protein n=1 Tax=Lysinibacter cavernae TaxID=1640652 RepID=A0A7X5R253_9MICO|nr:PQQ-binding-like beta-propeller repeat protein [Lysinibacter cavernae]NIH54284.1 hypothetical protein [Lysinibacter cavernae]